MLPRESAATLFCTILPMPAYAYAILAAGWLFWMTPFLLIKRNRAPGAKLDRRARWGVLLEALAYSMLWWGNFWTRSPQPWRVAISVIFFLLAGFYPGPAPEPWAANGVSTPA